MGAVLERFCDARVDVQVLVLCGHTHSPCDYRHRPNLRVLAGTAEYGRAMISAHLDLADAFG